MHLIQSSMSLLNFKKISNFSKGTSQSIKTNFKEKRSTKIYCKRKNLYRQKNNKKPTLKPLNLQKRLSIFMKKLPSLMDLRILLVED